MTSFNLQKIDANIIETIKELLPEHELVNFLNGSSKRIRSKLAMLFINAYGLTFDDNIYNILTAGELIHNASLLHDDVIDDSDLRRGVTAIGKKYSSDISILCGDYVVAGAIELLLKINNNEISEIFNKCVQNMASSEVKQFFMREKLPKIEYYIEICKGKTAGLFSAILESCAFYLNSDKNLFKKFGETFGILFQIKNDMESFSASVDKKNKVYTAADILGIENALILSDNYKEELRGLLMTVPKNGYRSELESIINEL